MNIGDKIADFVLPVTGDAGSFRLSEASGKTIVLYFYPKDDTPGCTLEGQEFSATLAAFEAANALVFGISRDNLRSHEKFRATYDYQHHLIADTDATLCQYFDVFKEKIMYGKPVKTIARSTFIIDGNGQLAYLWRDIKSVAGHVSEVLEKVKQLSPKSPL